MSTFRHLIDAYKKWRGVDNDRSAANKLGMKSSNLSKYAKNDPGPRALKSFLEQALEDAYWLGWGQANEHFLGAAMDYRGFTTTAALSRFLGVKQPQINSWKNGHAIPLPRLRTLFSKVSSPRLEPLLELADITPVRSGGGWRIDTREDANKRLRSRLDGRIGLYIFYDSRGLPVYVGKSTTNLFKEIRQRLRGEANRKIYRHQMQKKENVQFGEVARLLSAYEILDIEAIHNYEAVLLRTFANQLLNKNLGTLRTG